MTSHSSSDAAFWKRKLAAFLHDSPSKALDIGGHELRASAAYVRAGLEDYIKAYDHTADHTAAAADRLPFPSRQITCRFDGVGNRFRHPLAGGDRMAKESRPLCVADAEATEGALQPQITLPADWDEGRKWRAHFFAHWRLWQRNCTESNPALAFLPADTRLPDHTIWHHMGVVSALAATHGKPAFLKFQLGPVQDFIAAARSTRDLWSASYLLSWLMATGLAALAREIGPDSVIFPNLQGQPLIDLQFRDELWAEAKTSHHGSAKAVWESLGHEPADLLTPNLPNVFLAVVPADRATELARFVEKSIRDEWEKIAAKVWQFSQEIIRTEFSPKDARVRFDAQVCHHLEVAWQTTPWPSMPIEAIALTEKLLPGSDAQNSNSTCQRLRDFIEYFTETMPREHRDCRYYEGGKDGPKTQLNNVGLAWSVLVSLTSWQLDAARQTRAFAAWSTGGWENESTHNAKDALTGREEMIVGGKPWHDSLEGKWRKLFRHPDEVGAITLIKRTWHLAYLEAKPWDLPASPQRGFFMPNTQEIAAGNDRGEGDGIPDTVSNERPLYFAVLALDGDSIGRIVAGEATPTLGDQLADYGSPPNRLGAQRYFEENNGRDLLGLRRPLSPGFHLQFSAALSNFAVHCVRPIIDAHRGKLLYAGGDDVLAMLPASEALPCADALQRAFRGEEPTRSDYHLCRIAPGFLARTDRLSDQRLPIPFLVPGSACTASVGVAIAHANAPLQDVVRAARAAEKRAKRLTEKKHALAVTVFKRSGEITEWACRFGDTVSTSDSAHRGGLPALTLLTRCLDAEILSAKFPHRMIELLEPYLMTEKQEAATGFEPIALLDAELRHALSRQHGPKWNTDATARDDVARFAEKLVTYAQAIPPDTRETRSRQPDGPLRAVIGLCTVAAFLRRQVD